MNNLLDIQNLNVSFRNYGLESNVLKDVGLRIPEGGRVASGGCE